jgi:PEP-CTERM motif
MAYDGNTLLGNVTSAVTGQYTISFSAPLITRVVITPGSFNGWVGVDNINYTTAIGAVPEPETYAPMALGLAAVGLARRRTNSRR